MATAEPERGVIEVVAVGRASVFAGTVQRAREAALRSAYAEAVARGAGVSVGRLTVITNIKAVSDVVATRSRGFVRSYEIVSEGLVDDDPSEYVVTIRAKVVIDKIGTAPESDTEGLRLYLSLLGNPKLLVVLPQLELGGEPDAEALRQDRLLNVSVTTEDAQITVRRREAELVQVGSGAKDLEPEGLLTSMEAAIAQAFSRLGYQVVTSDELAARGVVPAETIRGARAGVTEDALQAARAVDADLALIGVLRISQRAIKPYGVDFMSVTGEASAKALIVSSGYLIDAFHTTTTRAHPSALSAAATVKDRIAEEFASVLGWKIPSILASQARETRVVLENCSLTELQRIKERLLAETDVEAVRVEKPPSANEPWAELTLLTGFVRPAQDELVDLCERATGRPLEVLHSNSYSLRLRAEKGMEGRRNETRERG